MIKFDKTLKSSKNLLAFSAGVDSTALFFLLLESDIKFDIAIVNYNLRDQSKLEVQYAKELAKKYNKKIFIKEIDKNEVDKIKQNNFEAKAREIRYSFFDEIIINNSYDNLILAHQLNDKLEWFLMQFSKGAGLFELGGMVYESKRANYTILRPLLEISKVELLAYLQTNNIKYFVDQSNSDTKYKRNYFRKEFADRFLDEFKDGVKNSFDYIQKDIESLSYDFEPILSQKELTIYKYSDENIAIRIIDKRLKELGYILSKSQRDEVLRQKEIVIDKFAISIVEDKIWISPYSDIIMDKKFKEKCRIDKIPHKHRGYLFENKLNLS